MRRVRPVALSTAVQASPGTMLAGAPAGGAFGRVLTAWWATSILLCLPTIVGTGIILVGVLSEPLHDHSRLAPFGVEVTDWMRQHVLWPIWLASFVGAAHGPALIPFAACAAAIATRKVRWAPVPVLQVWAPVVLAGVAWALFEGWLTHMKLWP